MADEKSRAGRNFYGDADILTYLEETHLGKPAPFDDVFRSAGDNEIPTIMVGKSEGKFVGMLLKLAGAKKVVEVGTLAGYSACWIASHLPEDGHLYTFENDPHHAQVATANLKQANLWHKVTILVGPALNNLPSIEEHGPFDAVFLDADKENYHRYTEWAVSHTKTGGLLLGDNSFLFGELVSRQVEAAVNMRKFHELASRYYDCANIPTPDGLLLGVKRSPM